MTNLNAHTVKVPRLSDANEVVTALRDPAAEQRTIEEFIANPTAFFKGRGYPVPENASFRIRNLPANLAPSTILAPLPDPQGRCPAGWVAQQTIVVMRVPALFFEAEICRLRLPTGECAHSEIVRHVEWRLEPVTVTTCTRDVAWAKY